MADRIITYSYAAANYDTFKKKTIPISGRAMTKEAVLEHIMINTDLLDGYTSNRLVPIIKVQGLVQNDISLIISFALPTPGIGSLTVSIDNVPTVYTTDDPYIEIIVAKGSSITVQVKGIGPNGAMATKSLLIDEDNVGNRYTGSSNFNISTPPIIINNVTNIQAEVS